MKNTPSSQSKEYNPTFKEIVLMVAAAGATSFGLLQLSEFNANPTHPHHQATAATIEKTTSPEEAIKSDTHQEIKVIIRDTKTEQE